MIRKLSPALMISICIGSAFFVAIALSKNHKKSNTFNDTQIQFIESDFSKNGTFTQIEKKKFDYYQTYIIQHYLSMNSHDDWYRINPPNYLAISDDFESNKTAIIQVGDEVSIDTYGSFILNMTYGKSEFTDKKYQRYDEHTPTSRIIDSGFNLERELMLHMESRVGKRLTIYIDHDSKKEDNQYLMQYRAVNDDEVIREINSGDIDIDFNDSKYAVYDDTSSKGLGMDITLKKGDLQVKAFGSIMKGETEVEKFSGNSSPNFIKLAEYQYIKNTYFQLEPFKRNDRLDNPPVASSEPYSNLVTFTSFPLNQETFQLLPVNIDPAMFELYMDDQDPNNNQNAICLENIDSGYYDKLVSGIDFTINYSTGLITFLNIIPNNARIFAVYTINNGSSNSSDPAARVDVDPFSGKIFVFIKYGYSINEDLNFNFIRDTDEYDVNNDNRLNLDIYEVRSIYNIGEKQLLKENFSILFYRDNALLDRTDILNLGKYTINNSEGLILFVLREPFRYLLANDAHSIYSENQSSNVFTHSHFNIRVDYYREARNFQLKHSNIIPDSVRIRINGREIASSLFSVDYTSGFLEFTDPNNPIISSETEIEIRYEYLPSALKSKSIITGLRTDYRINRNLNIGGSLLFTKDSNMRTIPNIGDEPEQTLLLEADSSLHLGEKSIKKIVKNITGYKAESIPLEINAYAEYAKSYKKINTFGKALIDDMEGTDEIISLSLSEKNWVLSSMPFGISQNDRGKIYYYYYRNPSDPGTLEGIDFAPYSIPYSTKPGPYNIATGHIPDSVQEIETQRSLVLNFDFSSGDHVPIVTRQLTSKTSSEAIDFSGLQYLEIWYRSTGGTGEVELYIDIGEVAEDSDNDGILDTEDINGNSFLDFDPDAGINEDIGYEFTNVNDSTRVGTGPKLNSITMGDGVLNSEDLNNNGVLDITENTIRFPGDVATIPDSLSNTLIIDLNDTTWKKSRIYLDKESSAFLSNSYYYEELLKKIESVRLFLKKRGGADTGTLMIDSVRFVSSSWRENNLRITKVDTVNDSDYNAESYMLLANDNYESLHGDEDEEQSIQRETALEIEYDLFSDDKGYIQRKFIKPIDIRFYKTLIAWFNFREFTNGDYVRLQIGSSESDYFEYEIPMEYQSVWREIRLDIIGGGSSANFPVYQTVGSPDKKRILFIKLIIYGQGTGKLWINDIYLSEPDMLKDSAYWYEGEIKIKRPLFLTDNGVPVLSNVNIKYVQKGHGREFSTVGKTTDDVMEDYRGIFSEALLLPNWITRIDFIEEKSETDSLNEDIQDSKRGNTKKKSMAFESDYISNIHAFPSIKLLYKHDDYENAKEEYLALNKIKKQTYYKTFAPTLILDERVTDIFGGILLTKVALNVLLKEERIKRNYAHIYSLEPADSLSPEEIEKRQKGAAHLAIDYHNRYFFFKPSVDVSSHEIVEFKGRVEQNDTGIISDLNGDFHFPLIYNQNFKFVERDKRSKVEFGLIMTESMLPSIRMEFSYTEKGFRDYELNERSESGKFSRAKDAGSFISNNINVPLKFSGFETISFIKNLVLNYTRSIYFQETDIPYEGEGLSAFDEEFGIRRPYNGFIEASLNHFSTPPWYFFRGRGSFANARDYVYKLYNENIRFSAETTVPNYNNSLKLIDNISVSSMFDFDISSLNTGCGISQVTERQIIFGIPQEVVTINYNININLDLMRIFDFGFFRPNVTGNEYHASNINLSYNFNRNMLITSNIEENEHIPGIGIIFKWDRSSTGFTAEVDYRQRKKRDYISHDDSKRARSDDIFIENMQFAERLKDTDRGWHFSIFYETDPIWIFNIFSKFYKLVSYPIFFLEYSLILNRYDYTTTTSPEPYDQHLITAKLTLDLHKNIQGGVSGRYALERFRNRETGGITEEIQSYELGMNFSLLF